MIAPVKERARHGNFDHLRRGNCSNLCQDRSTPGARGRYCHHDLGVLGPAVSFLVRLSHVSFGRFRSHGFRRRCVAGFRSLGPEGQSRLADTRLRGPAHCCHWSFGGLGLTNRRAASLLGHDRDSNSSCDGVPNVRKRGPCQKSKSSRSLSVLEFLNARRPSGLLTS